MKKIVFLIAFLVHLLVASAQTDVPFTNALLWKVSGNELTEPSYIFGTFHLFTESFIDSIPGLTKAMEETAQVVGELDMENTSSIQTKIMQMAVLPEEESYRNLLSEEEYTRLDEGLKSILSVGLDQMEYLKPGIIGSSLSVILYMKVFPELDLTHFEGVDAYIQRIAREKGKPTIGLETAEEQIHLLLDAHPQRFQMESLLCTVEHFDEDIESLNAMIDDYRQGNLNKMYNDSFADQENPCFSFSLASKDGMLKYRNDKWIAQLPQIMAEKSSLIVVGALHLAAEEGLLYQLNKLGYTIEAVKSK